MPEAVEPHVPLLQQKPRRRVHEASHVSSSLLVQVQHMLDLVQRTLVLLLLGRLNVGWLLVFGARVCWLAASGFIRVQLFKSVVEQ